MKDKLSELLAEYFSVDCDCYAYNLVRDKSAFAIGTMSLNDFKEFDVDVVDDLAGWLIEHGVTV